MLEVIRVPRWKVLAIVIVLSFAVLKGPYVYAQISPGSFVTDEVVVKFRSDASPALINSAIADCGTETNLDSTSLMDAALASPYATGTLPSDIDSAVRNLFWLRIIAPIPDVGSTVACFEARPDIVEFAQPNFVGDPGAHQANHYPNDPQFTAGQQWSLHNAGQNNPAGVRGSIDADIDVVQSWDLPHSDCRNVVVAVFDTGADLAHPDLRNNLWVNPLEGAGKVGVDDDGNGFIDDTNGFDFTEAAPVSLIPPRVADTGNDGPQDTQPAGAEFGGHGHSVASIIGAEGNNGVHISGICWRAQLMIMRVGAPGGSDAAVAFSTLYVLLQKFQFGQPVRVVNLSYSSLPNTALLRLAVNAMGAGDVLLVSTAGNLGANVDTAGNNRFPCNLTNANLICVAASTNRDLLADFSSFGAVSVDLAAPGESIITLRRGVDGGGVTPPPGINGTSFAAPHVTGIAALAFSLFPGKTAVQVKQDILFGDAGPPAASGTDVIKTDAANTIFGRVLTNGRLRWPYTGDLGDAPVTYETVASPVGGALHWDIGNEYLGRDVTQEVDANTAPPLDQDPTANIIPTVNRDLADYPLGPGDGRFSFKPLPPWAAGQRVDVDYDLCSDHLGIADEDGGRYQGGNSDRTLYVNAWFDLNRNGLFEAGELLMEDIISPPPASPILPKPNPNVTVNQHAVLPLPDGVPVFPPLRRCVPIHSHFNVPAPGGIPTWIRFRLDYGEDIMANDPDPVFRADRIFPMFQHLHWARYGEVEDFLICDIDANGSVDKLDLSLISKTRGQNAQFGDPRDANGDGRIDPVDVKVCIPLCTSANCAAQ